VGTQKRMAGDVGKPQARYPEHDDDGAVLIEKEVEVDKTEAVVDGKFQANLTELLEYRHLNGESFRWCVCVSCCCVCFSWVVHTYIDSVCLLLSLVPLPTPQATLARPKRRTRLAVG
jgi:hypothetical protein